MKTLGHITAAFGLPRQLATNLANNTCFALNLYAPPSLHADQPEATWLVRSPLTGGLISHAGTSEVWDQIKDLADSHSPTIWPTTLERLPDRKVAKFLVDGLGMPGFRKGAVTDPAAVATWAAWNREALRLSRVFEKSCAPSNDALALTEHAVPVGPRFIEEATTFLQMPRDSGVTVPSSDLADALWRLASACRSLDLIESRRNAVLGTAGLNTEEDFLDLRELAHRENADARIVVTTLERLEREESECMYSIDAVASDLEFTVRDLRMSKKQKQVAEARQLIETLSLAG